MLSNRELNLETLKLHFSTLEQEMAMQREELEAVRATLEETEALATSLSEQSRSVLDESVKWQREATYYTDIATNARDQLVRRESEVRVLQLRQEDLEKELAEYKNSSRCLLEEKEREVEKLRKQQQHDRGGGSVATLSPSATSLTSVEDQQKISELTNQLNKLETQVALDENEKIELRREREIAKRELVQQQAQYAQQVHVVDSLRLELHALQESLEGEVVAHRESRSIIRKLRDDLKVAPPWDPAGSTSAATASDSATIHATTQALELTRLRETLQESQQRHQMLSYQLMERQTTLEARTRDAADWKARYDMLAQRTGDEEIAVAAGYGILSATPPGRNGAAPVSERFGGDPLVDAKTARIPMLGKVAAGSGVEELRRTVVIGRLARKGRGGRLLVGALVSLDNAALRVIGVLRGQALVRMVAVLYVIFLQLWVVLLFLANYTYTVQEGGAEAMPAPGLGVSPE